MITPIAFRKLALSLQDAEELPHFEKASFRIKKRIFATLDEAGRKATLKLSPQDQAMFHMADKDAVYPVPNKWGLQGWTIIDLALVKKDVLMHALDIAYCGIAPKQLAEPVMAKYS